MVVLAEDVLVDVTDAVSEVDGDEVTLVVTLDVAEFERLDDALEVTVEDSVKVAVEVAVADGVVVAVVRTHDGILPLL
jgi:hypothetical protein